jgi:hypothetical protein
MTNPCFGLATVLLAWLLTIPVQAQPAGGQGRPPGGPPILDNVRAQIGCTDEEWKVIGPKLRRVLELRQAVSAAGPGPGAEGGPGRAGNDPFLGPAGEIPGAGRRGGPGPGGNDPFIGPTGELPGRGPGVVPEGAVPARVVAPGGPGGGPGGPGGRGPGRGNAVAEALLALQEAVAQAAPADELRERVATYRLLRQKAQRELEAAQKDLLLLLTAEQEAVLVSLRLLD